MTDIPAIVEPKVSLPGVGQISESSLATARETWARQFVPPAGADSQDAIAHHRGRWMERFDAAARPGPTETPLASPEEERAYQNLAAYGMTPAAIAEVRSSKAATPEEHEAARNWRAAFLKDTERQRKYLAGDTEIGKAVLASSFILSLPIKAK